HYLLDIHTCPEIDDKVVNKEPKSLYIVELEATQIAREKTFLGYPHAIPSKSQFISAGWFYCGRHDRVCCIYCEKVCHQWTAHDDPSAIHRLVSPNCPYFKSNSNSVAKLNIVTIINEENHSNYSIDATICNEIVANRIGQYSSIPVRVKTFDTWPSELKSMTEDLVTAGFYSTGMGTIVCCFYCNGSLSGMGQNHSPMIEHARWYPNCDYARQLCGTDLYDRIQQLYGTHHRGINFDFSDQIIYHLCIFRPRPATECEFS
ncbi:unnamed protein product, partial [Didymodactylos carnosus]